VARARLTTRRLLGIDRSGPPPPETLRGQPLNPWTIPNAVGFVRLALIPVALVLALDSGDGRTASATVLFIIVAASDYLDGLLARITGQYSRLGTLLDPLTDRLVILAAVIVNWRFELSPRWALAVLAGRELFMLVLTRIALKRGLDLQVNMLGRWAVWPVMAGVGLPLLTASQFPEYILYLGLFMTLGATALYVRDGLGQLRRPSTSA
jgi:cardiolipin synthase